VSRVVVRRNAHFWAMLLALHLAPPCWGAPSIWQRTRLAQSADERETLRSIERVLGGEAEEMDLLRARTAVVELMREQIRNPRTVVLLFHLRRQLGLSPARGGVGRLSAALSAELSHHDRALGWYELARLSLDLYWTERTGPDFESPMQKEAMETALGQLRRALDEAWEPELRAEVLSYRALTAFGLEDYKSARADFLRVTDLAVSSASLRDAYLGLGLVDLMLGDHARALRFLEWSAGEERHLSQAAPLPAFSHVPLAPGERQILDWSQAIARSVQTGAVPHLEPELCDQLRASDRQLGPSFAGIKQSWLRQCRARSDTEGASAPARRK
jgi:hypothetical protein